MLVGGDKINNLTAVKFDHYNKYKQPFWIFKCDCGKEKVISAYAVTCQHTKSCGCLNHKPRERKELSNVKRKCQKFVNVYHRILGYHLVYNRETGEYNYNRKEVINIKWCQFIKNRLNKPKI